MATKIIEAAELAVWLNGHAAALKEALPGYKLLIHTLPTDVLRASFFLRRPLEGMHFRALIEANLRWFAHDHPRRYQFDRSHVDTVIEYYLHNLVGAPPRKKLFATYAVPTR
jgi:hypothetical protein